MKNLSEILRKHEIPHYNSYFWEYQYKLGREFLVPYLESKGIRTKGVRVCEIGSAEGGILFAFYEKGENYCIGTDIEEIRLQGGRKIAQIFGYSIDFVRHNILADNIPTEWSGAFDIVVLRDVIEHLDYPALALQNIHKMLKEGGVLFITFPPYFSPFGGHQHLLHNFWGNFPYIHLLPEGIFSKLIASGRQADRVEVARLKKNTFTVEKFFDAVNSCNFEIVEERYFLIRPVYKFKFGLPTIEIPKPFINEFTKNFISTEAMFLLNK